MSLLKSIKKIGKQIVNSAKSLTHGNILKNAASAVAAVATKGASLQFDKNAQERLGSAVSKLLGGSDSTTSDFIGSFLNAFTGSYNATTGNNGSIDSLLGTGINWGNSIFSAQQAKEQAKYNSELNYKYQTKLNEQGYAHDKEMLGIQHAYDTQMANTAVQRQMADLQAAGINPAMASQLGGAGGGGLGGGSSLGGGTAQTDKANWLAYNLEKMAGQRDAQRVAIEQANSAKSAEVADKQMEKMDSDIAETLVRTGILPKQAEAQIKKSLASAGKDYADTAKAKAEKAKAEEETKKVIQETMSIIHKRKRGKAGEWLGDDPASNLNTIGNSLLNYLSNLGPNYKNNVGY